MQPDTTLLPVEMAGHETGVHVDAKKGELLVAVTDPACPALQIQPLGTLIPEESDGQLTAATG